MQSFFYLFLLVVLFSCAGKADTGISSSKSDSLILRKVKDSTAAIRDSILLVANDLIAKRIFRIRDSFSLYEANGYLLKIQRPQDSDSIEVVFDVTLNKKVSKLSKERIAVLKHITSIYMSLVVRKGIGKKYLPFVRKVFFRYSYAQDSTLIFETTNLKMQKALQQTGEDYLQ